jgi:SAM-dependent methyltransferase
MRISRRNREAAGSKPADLPPVYLDARAEFANRYLSGHGLEIGGLNWPLEVPPGAHVSQVDRMSTEDLRTEYPEVDGPRLKVDVVDDGETLATIPAGSQDFIIANHFLEHTQDPIGTIETHLGKLKPGGILFYAVPDKRYSFDFRRPLTPLKHMVRDHEHGPKRSRRQHFDEWTRLVGGEDADRADPAALKQFEKRASAEARELEAADFSIHTHVWNQASFLGLILHCRERFGEAFDIEATCQRSLEFVVVLRKCGAWPAPPPAPEPEVAAPSLPQTNGGHPEARSVAGRIRAALRAASGRQGP